jgi:two-component system, NarL family, sensor histidine kinase UhpB
LEHLLLPYNINEDTLKVSFVNELEKDKLMDRGRILMMYRVVQEQLNNILKHAQAKNITINLKSSESQIYLSIEDNGIGFDVHKQSLGIGLANISSRVSLYSGKMNITSSPGNGCMLEISIPTCP